MKKISMMVIALLAAITMSAETVVVDTLTSTTLGLKDAAQSYTSTTQTTSNSGAQYAAFGYGKQAYIQIRVTGSNSGVASTKSAGYIKSVRVIQNTEKGAKPVEIYGSNSVLTAPTDLYDSSKASKVASVSDLDKSFAFTVNYTYVGFRSGSGTAYIDKIIIEWTDTKPGKDPGVWTPDTISVSEARALIDQGDVNTHYIKGVVAGAPYVIKPSSYTVWLTDIDNPSDSIEAYTMRKGKATTDLYTSVEEMAEDFGLQDTVLIFAEGIAKFKSTYETTSGYYVETLGKSSAINANDIYKYAIGAVYKDTVKGKYTYDIAISPEGTEAYENALHMVIRSANAKGIAGSYTLYATGSDSSYVDGADAVSGSLKITYVSEGAPANVYKVVADFKIGDNLYRMDTTYNLAGWLTDLSDSYKLVDDVPYIPVEGETITCAQALSYAKTLGTTTSSLTVYVKGVVNGVDKSIKGRTQQSIYMSDFADDKDSQFTGYICYTQNLDSIIVGDTVLVKGNILYYAAKSIAEISKGKIYRIGGSQTGRPRNPQAEAEPAGAITVEQALAIGNALQAAVGKTVYTDETYTVVGYIVDVNRQVDNDSATWYMADVKGAYGEFKAYRCAMPTLICENDKVYVTGKISKYQKSESEASIEIAKGQGGFIEISTAIQQVAEAAEQTGATKLIMGGQLYIMKHGVLYNALGVKVQ